MVCQGDVGVAVVETCRKTGISQATYHNWKKKRGELMPSSMPACATWNRLKAEAGRITSLCSYAWIPVVKT